MRTKRTMLGAVLVVTTLLAPARAASAQAQAGSQAALSLGGTFAQSMVYNAAFPDGTTRDFSALLVQPQAVTATAPEASLDISRSWAVLTETMASDPRKAYQDDGSEACSAATNTSPTALSAPTSFDVVCDDGAGYAFYRVAWTPGPQSVQVTNPAVNASMGDETVNWSAGGLAGAVVIWPSATEITAATVCGFRPTTAAAAGHFECFGGAQDGFIAPATGLMLAQYSSAPTL